MSAKDKKNPEASEDIALTPSGAPFAMGVPQKQEGGEDDLWAIDRRISELQGEIAKLKDRQGVIIEQRYKETSRTISPGVHAKRSRDITKILRGVRSPGEDALRGQMRQMQAQMASFAHDTQS